jgi:hypothetical protein
VARGRRSRERERERECDRDRDRRLRWRELRWREERSRSRLRSRLRSLERLRERLRRRDDRDLRLSSLRTSVRGVRITGQVREWSGVCDGSCALGQPRNIRFPSQRVTASGSSRTDRGCGFVARNATCGYPSCHDPHPASAGSCSPSTTRFCPLGFRTLRVEAALAAYLGRWRSRGGNLFFLRGALFRHLSYGPLRAFTWGKVRRANLTSV